MLSQEVDDGPYKIFEPEIVLDKALELFWSRGYSATSLNDLLAHMQISRQSLYDTFGDKHRLFLAALDRYTHLQGQGALGFLAEGGSVRTIIRAMFHGQISQTNGDSKRGCFVVNTITECVPHYPDITVKVVAGTEMMEDLLTEIIRHAQQSGELRSSTDARLVGRYLVVTLQGLLVQAKRGADLATLDPILDLALDVLQ